MFDGIKLVYSINKDLLKQQWLPKQTLFVSEETGEVICHKATYKSIHVHIYEGHSALVVKLNGSLHKYYFGTNDALFTYADICSAVPDFASSFSVDIAWPCLRSIEIGVNIPVNNPEKIVESAILYHGRGATKYERHGDGIMYKEWSFDDYTVKLYVKGPSTVRYEMHYSRLRRLKGVQISSLADLMDRNKFILCLFNLYFFTKEFLFVPAAQTSLPDELRAKWANWRNDHYWTNLERSRKSREKASATSYIAVYGLDDWRSLLANAVVEQGARMLGTSVECLAATFSNSSLSPETVASPERDCDRLVEETKAIAPACRLVSWSNCNLSVSIHLVQAVANALVRMSVNILASCYSLIWARAPPGARSIGCHFGSQMKTLFSL